MGKDKSLVNKKLKHEKIEKEKILLLIVVLFIIIIDQGIKLYVTKIQEIQVIPNILKFSVMQNTKPAYGIGSGSTFMYVLTNLVVLSVIFKFITTQNEYVDIKLKIFLCFILAGGISNIIDRLIRGYVVEFIDFTQIINLPVFNIADLFTLVGWVSIAAIFAVFTINEWRDKKN